MPRYYNLSVNSTSCCGMDEIAGIPDHRSGSKWTPEDVLLAFVREILGVEDIAISDCFLPFYWFAQAKASKMYRGWCVPFVQYIEKNGLGTVVASPERRNPNSDNYLTIYVWAVNRAALAKWFNSRKDQ